MQEVAQGDAPTRHETHPWGLAFAVTSMTLIHPQ
jgi:hypothetical protein